MGRHCTALAIAVLAVCLSGGAERAEAAGDGNPSFSIDRADGRLVVRAEDAAVEDVVGGLGERLGFEVNVLTSAERPPVNGKISGKTVAEVLRRLLRDRNYALLYESTDDRTVTRVDILSPPAGERWKPETVGARRTARGRTRRATQIEASQARRIRIGSRRARR